MERRLASVARALVALLGRDDDRERVAARAALEPIASSCSSEDDTDHTDSFASLRDSFGLSELEQSIMAVAASADLDERFSLAFNALLGSGREINRPTIGVTLRLCGLDLNTVGRSALADHAPLRRNGLLAVEGTEPFALRTLRVPDRVLAHLVGEDRPTLAVQRLVAEVSDWFGPIAREISSALECGTHLVHLRSTPGSPGIAGAQGGFAHFGAASLTVDMSRRDRTARPRDILRDVVREAGLQRAGLVLTGVAALLEEDPSLISVINDGQALAVIVDDHDWEPPGGPRTVRIEAPSLSRAERQELWTSNLIRAGVLEGPAEEHAAALASMRLSPEAIEATVDEATTSTPSADAFTATELRAIAQTAGATRLTTNAVRIAPNATRHDLILNDANEAALDQLVAWGRLREDPRGRALLGGRRGSSSGVTALFTGPPGTGKTLAAEVVAAELQLDLFVVNLSQVVDKYIGETEKRLEKIITESESLGVVLLFDEADSVFGARSAVKDSKDRYANQTISFLLQRIERYDGIIILTSNFRGNIDAAFTRRIHHIVHFPEPDEAARRQMWEVHLGIIDTDPEDEVDVAALAQQLQLVGGEIRNVVMHAGFSALTENPADPRLGMRHLMAAARQEHAKMNKMMPAIKQRNARATGSRTPSPAQPPPSRGENR